MEDIIYEGETFVSKVCAKMTYNDCLQQARDQDHNGSFTGALACIFDVDHRVVGQLYNLDFLRRPSIKTGESMNYIQWVGKRGKGDNIEEILTYLFSPCNRHGEKFQHTENQQARIDAYVRKVMFLFLFPGAQDARVVATSYLDWLGRRFWRDPVDFREEYEGFIPCILSSIERVK